MTGRLDVTNRGFTLLEMLAILVVVGIAMAFVVHGIGRAGPRLSVQADASEIASEIARTRALALAERRAFMLEIVSGRGMRIRRRTNGGWSDAVFRSRFRPSVEVSVNGSDAGSLVFLPEGRVAAPATIAIAGSERREVIFLWASGMTKRTRQ